MIIEKILESAVIVAIISNVTSLVLDKKKKNHQFKEEERKKKREDIQQIIVELHGATQDEIVGLLARIKLIINAYGNNDVLVRYSNDAHIWQLINEMEEKALAPEDFKMKQKQMIEYLSLLLEKDLDRYKQETKGDKLGILGIVLLLFLGVCFVGSIYFWGSGSVGNFTTETVNAPNINILILIIESILYFLFIIPFTNYMIAEASATYDSILACTIKSKPEQYTYKKLVLCILVWAVTIVILFVVNAWVLKSLFKITPCGELTDFVWIICIFIYLLAEFLLSWTRVSDVNISFNYNLAINKVREKYSKVEVAPNNNAKRIR